MNYQSNFVDFRYVIVIDVKLEGMIKTHGIFRIHQFEKIEQLCITESKKMFHEMINNTKEFYDSLGLSYCIVGIVSGVLNNATAIKYDIEVYFNDSKTYKNFVSCSNCIDFFSKRLNIKDKYEKYFIF